MKKAKKNGKASKLLRRCFPCTACCTTLAVEEIDKPMGTPCDHCTTGCEIYNKRPKACRSFKCCWLEGLLPVELRPDLSGLLFHTGSTVMGATMHVRELREGALAEPDNRDLIQVIRDAGPMFIVPLEGDRIASVPPNHPAEAILRKIDRDQKKKAKAKK